MSALAKPNFFSASALNPTTLVNADLVASLDKHTVENPNDSTQNKYEIHFHYVHPYTSIVVWRYEDASTRDTAFTAIKGAIATSST